MAVIGLPTNDGLNQSIAAQNDAGYYIKPTRFVVSDTAGPWSMDRTEDQNPPGWYSEKISGFQRVGNGTVEFTCTIPPGASPTSRNVREIQIYCEDKDGNEFFFAFGQPGDPPSTVTPLPYFPTDMLKIRLQIIISPLAIDSVFEFVWSQAMEIEEHNLNPDSHPEILKLLAENGIYMFASQFKYQGQWVDPFPEYVEGEVADGDWVYKGSDGKYHKAIADRSEKQKTPGKLEISDEGKGKVIYGGLVTYATSPVLEQGQTLYLSSTAAGKASANRSPRPLGTSLGSGLFLVGGGVGAGGGDGNHVAVQSDYLAAADDFIHVFFQEGQNKITVTLPSDPQDGDMVTVLDAGQATNTSTRVIAVDGNGNGIDDAEPGDADMFNINVAGAMVRFIFEPTLRSWAIDIGGRVVPTYKQNTNVYYWPLSADGGTSLPFKQQAWMPNVPKDPNPFHYLVQVGKYTLPPTSYSIDVSGGYINFNEAPEGGSSVTVRYIGSGQTVDGCPISLIGPFPKSAGAPDGWLLCSGLPYDPEVFPSLYDKLGEAVLPLVETDPDSFIAYYIKAFDAQVTTGYMNSLLGVPVGFESTSWPGKTAPAGWLDQSADYSPLPRAAFPGLWAFAVASGNIVDDSEWLRQRDLYGVVGHFSSGDGQSTFRVPLKKRTYDRAFDPESGEDIGMFIDGEMTATSNPTGSVVRLPIIKAYDTVMNASPVDIQGLIAGLGTKVDAQEFAALVQRVAALEGN